MDCLLKIKQQYQSKKILVLGLGLQGGGLAGVDFFSQIGCQIRVSDLRTSTQLAASLKHLTKYHQIKFEFGGHTEDFVSWADVIVRNPGVSIRSPILDFARKQKKEIILPSAFFLKHCPMKTIGITGTRGKSTTTNLIYQLLRKKFHSKVLLAGNLPQYSAFKLIPRTKTASMAVLELSSWELQGCRDLKISPQLAILTNIYPDHLNYYTKMEDYIDDKMQIFAHQKPNDIFLTLKPTYESYQQQIDKYRKGKLVLVEPTYYRKQPKYLLGKHNLENASLALKAGELLGLSNPQSTLIIKNFQSLVCRLQNLGTVKKTLFFNDSTSTTPIAGIKALEAISQKYPQRKIILIVGGKDKNLPFTDWIKIVNQLPEKIYLLPGSFSDLVSQKITRPLTKVNDLITLFKQLLPQLNNQVVVLFSPSATSFASFNNEFDRGKQFTDLFKHYQEQYGP